MLGPAVSGKVWWQFEFEHRRLRAIAQRAGGDVEFARVLAGDDDRKRILGVPRSAHLLVDEDPRPGASSVSGFSQVVDVVDDDDGWPTEARQSELEEEFLQFAQFGDEYLSVVVDEEVRALGVLFRKGPRRQIIDELRSRGESIPEQADDLA